MVVSGFLSLGSSNILIVNATDRKWKTDRIDFCRLQHHQEWIAAKQTFLFSSQRTFQKSELGKSQMSRVDRMTYKATKIGS